MFDGFADLLDFLWSTGCRPKEARDLAARHVHLQRSMCVFPLAEAKGDEERVVFLTPATADLLGHC